MASDDLIKVNAKVIEVLPAGKFRVETTEGEPFEAIVHLSGKMRQHKIRIVLGDQVRIEVSPYDMTRGRIVHRK